MNPIDAIAHYTARLPDNPDLDSPVDRADREALMFLVAVAHELAAAQLVIKQLRLDIAHAADWFREPGVSGVEVFPWLLARTGIDPKDPEPVEDE